MFRQFLDFFTMIRLFKQTNEFEVWKRTTAGTFKLFKTYDICAYSGGLGPKVKEGDRQAPEGFYNITPGLMNPNSSLEEQAMVVGTLNHGARTLDGFFQDGAFLKLREASVRWALPTQVASLMRARTVDMIFSGRNLGTWSKYRGIDAENNYQITDGSDAGSDFQTIGLASYWTLRFNLGF